MQRLVLLIGIVFLFSSISLAQSPLPQEVQKTLARFTIVNPFEPKPIVDRVEVRDRIIHPPVPTQTASKDVWLHTKRFHEYPELRYDQVYNLKLGVLKRTVGLKRAGLFLTDDAPVGTGFIYKTEPMQGNKFLVWMIASAHMGHEKGKEFLAEHKDYSLMVKVQYTFPFDKKLREEIDNPKNAAIRDELIDIWNEQFKYDMCVLVGVSSSKKIPREEIGFQEPHFGSLVYVVGHPHGKRAESVGRVEWMNGASHVGVSAFPEYNSANQRYEYGQPGDSGSVGIDIATNKVVLLINAKGLKPEFLLSGIPGDRVSKVIAAIESGVPQNTIMAMMLEQYKPAYITGRGTSIGAQK